MQIPPQKRKWLIGGCLSMLLLGAVALISGGWLIFSSVSPINRLSAIEATTDWARLADIPATHTNLKIETAGSMFTREFRISFRDTPHSIRAWLSRSPGPSSVTPVTDSAGWRVYSYPAGEGATFSEVRISPSEDEVKIHTSWS